jgi:hypothetical protein
MALRRVWGQEATAMTADQRQWLDLSPWPLAAWAQQSAMLVIWV